jgi:two-component system, OmpR family, response regulator
LKAFTTPGGQYRVYADDLHAFLSSRKMRIPEEIVRLASPEQRCVLIVEDDEDLNQMLFELLRQNIAEYTVLQAFDGFSAGRMITEKKPILILLDINLPGIDGHELIKTIKTDPDLENPLVVAMSGIADEISAKATIIKEGADAFISKPVSTEDFLKVIRTFLSKG